MALLELQLARVVMVLPPASPFGADRLDRSAANLTTLTPAPRTACVGARPVFVFAGRILLHGLRRPRPRAPRCAGVVAAAGARDMRCGCSAAAPCCRTMRRRS